MASAAATLLTVTHRVSRMSAAFPDIYASAPFKRLLAAETQGLLPDIQRCRGDHGLQISVVEADRAPALPMLACWTQLRLSGGRYEGDLCGRADESLPFQDDAFELVILRHALEIAELPQAVLDEAVRVLSPGGLLVLSGVHPFSFWAPWMLWRTRQKPLRLRMPLQIGEWLRRASMQVESLRRVGHALPGSDGPLTQTQAVGGGYLLMARKRRVATTPTRLVPKPLRAPVDAGLAPGARRNSA